MIPRMVEHTFILTAVGSTHRLQVAAAAILATLHLLAVLLVHPKTLLTLMPQAIHN